MKRKEMRDDARRKGGDNKTKSLNDCLNILNVQQQQIFVERRDTRTLMLT
jgi:hypothetical protein